MTIKLIIKGTAGEAIAYAALRQIPIEIVTVIERWPETIAICADDFRRQVEQWFCDASFAAPYPAGTLLWYGESNGNEATRGQYIHLPVRVS